MLKTIKINNRDLAYTIDSYGMFTGESFEEGESDYYTEEYELTPEEAQQIDYDYNHAGVVKDLASESINILSQNLVEHGTGVVKSIDFVEAGSPQFYNYTTDHYTATWVIDVTKLNKYIKENQGAYNVFEQEHWSSVYDTHGGENFKPDDYLVAKLDFYTRNEYSVDDYNSSMWEVEYNAYAENTTPTPEFQKLLDKKTKELEAKVKQERLKI